MKRLQIRTALVVTVALLLITTIVTDAQGSANPRVLPPTSQVHGLTYGEWSARWWHFALSLPEDKSPQVGENKTQCAFERVGNVGLVVLASTLDKPLTCEVPNGTMIFLELLDAECSSLEPPPFHGENEAELIACAKTFVPTEMEASIDGVEIRNPDQYISLSPMYDFVVPDNNILGVAGGSTGKSVAYGAFLMLAPLSPGQHTIHTHGTYEDLGFTADRHLTLTVTHHLNR